MKDSKQISLFCDKTGDADTGIGPKQLLYLVFLGILFFILLVYVVGKLKNILK